MNCLTIFVFVAVAVVHVHAGGYVLKGGVVDFGKPLDYFDIAVQAGEIFWHMSTLAVRKYLSLNFGNFQKLRIWQQVTVLRTGVRWPPRQG